MAARDGTRIKLQPGELRVKSVADCHVHTQRFEKSQSQAAAFTRENTQVLKQHC